MKEITGRIQGDMFVWMTVNEAFTEHFNLKNFIFGYVPTKTTAWFDNDGFNGAKLKTHWYKKHHIEIVASGFAKVFEVRLIIPKSEEAFRSTIGFPAQVKLNARGLYKDRFYKSVEPAIRLWIDLKHLFERAQSSDELSKALTKIVRTRMKEKW
jgi:hypothetical protein